MASSPYACNIVIDLEFTFVPKDMRVGGIKNDIIGVAIVIGLAVVQWLTSKRKKASPPEAPAEPVAA